MRNITLAELRQKLGIEVNASSNATCPFCGKAKKLHFNDRNNCWRCSACGASGGVLHLYARYQLGMESLPSTSEGRADIATQMREFMGVSENTPRRPSPAPSMPPAPPAITPASDSQLNAVYTAMSSLAVFHLTAGHRKDLRKRGLTNAQIERNGYRSFPPSTTIPGHIVERYNSVDSRLKAGFTSKKAAQVQFGLYVAGLLEEQGFQLEGIPGFYRFGNHWCLTYLPGILIPTRNILGEIVVWQVRRNFAPKYMTLSCSDKPGAVNTSVSRCHFPLGHDKLTESSKIIVAEGPLKADVAQALTKDPCIYAAVPGISTTKDLLKNCAEFKAAGITEVFNAFDMDRLTNPNVRKGSVALTAELQNIGLQFTPMFWNENYAEQALMMYQTIAKVRNVQIHAPNSRISPFEMLSITADCLNQAGIDPGKQTEDSEYWDPATKGIDDYLYSQIQRRKVRKESSRQSCIRTYHETILRINSEPSA